MQLATLDHKTEKLYQSIIYDKILSGVFPRTVSLLDICLLFDKQPKIVGKSPLNLPSGHRIDKLFALHSLH
jgi:hypothetical protein